MSAVLMFGHTNIMFIVHVNFKVKSDQVPSLSSRSISRLFL